MRIPLLVILSLWAPLALAGPTIRNADTAAPPHGIDPAELAGLEPFWQGDMLFTPDGFPNATFTALGREPVPAEAYEASPGILYVAMQGVTLKPQCGNGDSANAALNCSPLVSAETNFPSYGNGSAQAALFQELANYYEPFNIVMTSERPPDWLPYTMAVVGGSAGLAGQGGGVCGVANVACDGLKRNHVSLTFPESCGGVAETAAQETSHNWGLEHVNDSTDLMYPFNNGGFKTYLDECNTIDHSTGGAVTQCTYVHEVYCPAGGGEQQNSYAELMGVFGPREVDSVAPEIVSIEPADGAQIGFGEQLFPTATVAENTNFLAAKWSVLESPIPDDLADYTKCTNGVCDADWELTPGTDPNTVAWDFVNIAQAPLGTYSFQFEVLDAYGNYDSATITVEVVEGEGTTDPGDEGTSADDGGSADDSGSADGTGDDGEAGSADDDDDGDDDDDDGTDTDDTVGGTGDDGGPGGCGCRADRTAPWSAFALLGLVLVRRRRAR